VNQRAAGDVSSVREQSGFGQMEGEYWRQSIATVERVACVARPEGAQLV
jgi:hypothetical protein